MFIKFINHRRQQTQHNIIVVITVIANNRFHSCQIKCNIIFFGFADLRFFRTLNDHTHDGAALSTPRHAWTCTRPTCLLSRCCTTFHVRVHVVNICERPLGQWAESRCWRRAAHDQSCSRVADTHRILDVVQRMSSQANDAVAPPLAFLASRHVSSVVSR